MKLPRSNWPDATLPLLRDPYRYISTTALRVGAPGFRTRLLGRPVICVTGHAAAELFYTPGAFCRQGAAPSRVRRVIFGPEGVVQGLDGAAHRLRKALFLARLDQSEQDRLIGILTTLTEERIDAWSREGIEVDLYAELRHILTACVFEWAGLPLSPQEVAQTVPDITALFERAGSVGPPHWRGLLARARMQRRMVAAVQDIRRVQGVAAESPADSTAVTPVSSPAAIVAGWRDDNGALLDPQIAAAELLNLLRPVVAVSVYGVHLAHALQSHPDAAQLAAERGAGRHAFVQEVRRYYPFFPLVAGIATRDLTLKGYRIPKGMKVALDLWGTGRDPAAWDRADKFEPRRFLDRAPDAFDMVPQGGGDHAINHRCPGECLTIRIMEHLTELLTRRIVYVPVGPAAALDMAALPALPKDGFTIGRVRRKFG